MASFLVEAYLPVTASLDEVERRVTRATVDVVRDRIAVRLVWSIHVAEDEVGLLLFDAASADAVRLVLNRAGLTAPRIVEAREATAAAG